MKQKKVLMVGTDVTTMGGIASVVNDYFASGLMDRLNVSYHPTHKDGTKIRKITFFFQQMLSFLFRVFGYQIIHIHTSHGWSYRRLSVILFTSFLLGKKTVLHVHGSQFDKYYNESSEFEKFIIRLGMRTVNVVVALSSEWKEKLKHIESRSNIVVILNTVDVDKYTVDNRHPHDRVTVLFLGRLGKRKGIYDILKAIPLIDYTKHHFVLAGDGDIENVKNLVNQSGLENYVTVPGWISGAQKRELFKDADIYILPSYHEGLPIGILEALAAGLPIISTPVGGISEAVIDGINGYLIKPGDVKALADKIQLLGADRELWSRFSQASCKLAKEKFGMGRAEEQLQQLYAALI